ncbi:Ig-like domain-containing protein [Corallococcus sp. M7]
MKAVSLRALRTMAALRSRHSATLLPSGRLLVAGGGDILGNGTASAEVFDPATGTWSSTGAMAGVRQAHTATLLPNGKVLVAGGASTSISSGIASAELYDPATGTWTDAGSMLSARRDHTATLLPSGKVLVAGGQQGSNRLTQAELYDPATGTWTSTGAMPAARGAHTATLLPNGKVLVAGGYDGDAILASASVYDPATGTWSSTGAMVSARSGHTATLLPNGKVLVAGSGGGSAELYDPATGTWASTGSLSTGHDSPTATLLPSGRVLLAGGYGSAVLEEYDPTTGTWTATGSLSTVRYQATATLLPSGKVLIAGGENGGRQSQRSVDLYDPGTGTWVSTVAATARSGHTATLLPSGKVLVTGGANADGTLATAEVFVPAAAAWASTGAMATARTRHTATLLPSGKVLVSGGANADGTLASAEVYDSATGAWASTGALGSPREGHTATLLRDGRVLVAGGSNSSGLLPRGEVYNPATGTWTSTGPMEYSRDRHTATLLPNGKVLVAGGNQSGALLYSAELYDPATGTWASTGGLNIYRDGHSAALLPNGKVLVIGGSGGGDYVVRAEEYDPARGTWALTGAMSTGRTSATATLLPSGNVVVTGGLNDSGPVAATEVYATELSGWISGGSSLVLPRSGHAATLLPDGQVLVTGGANADGSLDTAEMYDDTGAPYAWRPAFQAPDSRPGASIQLTGTGFRGVSEASGGNTQSSPTNVPLLGLMAVEGGALTRMSRGNYSDTSVTATVPAVPAGYYFLTVITNGSPGGRVVHVQGALLLTPVVLTPANGALLTTTTPVFSGTAEANSTVTLLLDGVAAGTTEANDSGDWSFTPDTALAQGTHTVSARTTDAEGNTSPDAPSHSFRVDSVAPDAPVIVTPANGAVVNSATPVLSGTAEANSTVSLLLDGVTPLTTTANGTGSWSVRPSTALAQGAHSFTAQAKDAAGNTSQTSAARAFSVDSVAPATPVVVTPAQGALLTTTTPVISGTTEPGSTVTLSMDGTSLAAVVDGTGNWSFTPSTALAQGAHSVTARATDAAGNTSQVSATRTFRVDSVAPPTPVVVTPASGAVVNTATPVLSGTAEANSTVILSIDGTPWEVVANGSGNWSFTPGTALAQGAHSVTAQARDAAGNTSQTSAVRAFSVDSVAPATPVVVTPANGALLNTATPVISGTAEPGSTVILSIDGTSFEVVADGTGNWSFTPNTALAQGAHSVTAQAKDTAGNTSQPSAARAFSVDSVAPAVPVVVTPASGAVVNTTTPVISGTAEAGSTVILSIDGTSFEVVADGSGNWSFTPGTALAQGAHSVTAQARDAAGNTSQPSASRTFSVDAVAPAAPVVVTPADGAVVNTATPVISGTAEAGSTVILSIDGTSFEVVADGSGNWSFTPGTALAQGAHSVTAQARNAAGNTSQPSASHTFSVDSVAPAAPVVVTPANGAVLNTAPSVISGTAEPGSTVTASIDGNVIGSTSVNSDGTWRFELTLALSSGGHTLVVSAVDAMGNQSPSVSTTFTISRPAPQVPQEEGGCSAAPASSASWLAIAFGISFLRRRRKSGAAK